MLKIRACCRNSKKPPSKSGGDFLLKPIRCCKSAAITMDRTQWFQTRDREFKFLRAHTKCKQRSIQNRYARDYQMYEKDARYPQRHDESAEAFRYPTPALAFYARPTKRKNV